MRLGFFFGFRRWGFFLLALQQIRQKCQHYQYRAYCDGYVQARGMLDIKGHITQQRNGKNDFAEDVFWKDLTPEGKKAFNAYYEKQMEMANIAEEDSFVRGVRFGAGLILDVVSDYRSQLPLMTEEAAG